MERHLSRNRPKMLALDYIKVGELDDSELEDPRCLREVAPAVDPDWAEPMLDAALARRALENVMRERAARLEEERLEVRVAEPAEARGAAET